MSKGTSKKDVLREIEYFFKSIEDKTPREVKKIKRLAMQFNIPLKKKKKLFCKNCFSVFNSGSSRIRIKKGFKAISCKNCAYVSRWKVS